MFESNASLSVVVTRGDRSLLAEIRKGIARKGAGVGGGVFYAMEPKGLELEESQAIFCPC